MNTDRFKFRVWDKKDEEYLDPDYYEGFYMSPDGVVHAGITEWNGICDKYQEIPQKQLIIEQCTGMRDKNGKLIYEGDVIKIVGGDFIPTGVKLEVCYGWISWQLRELVHGGYLDFYCGGSTFEIIGNIHDDHFRDPAKKEDEKVRQCEDWLNKEIEE